MRFRSILFIVLLLVTCFASAKNNFAIKTVVIDAGHGGKDPGAIGNGKTFEKDVALSVALKLGEYIQKNFPDVRVIYTRKTDVFLELHERAEIANKAKADLFIAIHCNSSTNEAVYGTSSYVLGLHKTEANFEVAKRENSVILLEDDRDKNYEFNPNTPEGHIIMSMKQNAFLDQSIHFASIVETNLENGASRKSLGVKQAGFYVLYKTAMPSLLAEIGFISNPDEEKYLNSMRGQEQIANALLNSFREYKAQIEGSGTETITMDETPKPKEVEKKVEPVVNPAVVKVDTVAKAVIKPEVKQPVKEVAQDPVVVKTVEKDIEYITLKDGTKIKKPVENASGGGKSVAVTPAPIEKTITPPTVVKKETVETKPEKPVVKETPAPAEAKVVSPVKPAPVVESNTEAAVVFKIQLFSLRENLKEKDKLTKLFIEISSEPLSNGLTRYYGGNTKSYKEAKRLLDIAMSNGYKDAYIVGIKDGKRLSYEQLRAFEGK